MLVRETADTVPFREITTSKGLEDTPPRRTTATFLRRSWHLGGRCQIGALTLASQGIGDGLAVPDIGRGRQGPARERDRKGPGIAPESQDRPAGCI
jgi:hypothetical protein